jgi:hypothetical protein
MLSSKLDRFYHRKAFLYCLMDVERTLHNVCREKLVTQLCLQILQIWSGGTPALLASPSDIILAQQAYPLSDVIFFYIPELLIYFTLTLPFGILLWLDQLPRYKRSSLFVRSIGEKKKTI